jgi:hypothetical protein
MNTRTSDSLPTQHVGGGLTVVIFAFTLIAFVVEGQVAQVSPARNCHHLVRHIHFIASTVCSDDARLPTAILYLVSFVRPLPKFPLNCLQLPCTFIVIHNISSPYSVSSGHDRLHRCGSNERPQYRYHEPPFPRTQIYPSRIPSCQIYPLGASPDSRYNISQFALVFGRVVGIVSNLIASVVKFPNALNRQCYRCYG